VEPGFTSAATAGAVALLRTEDGRGPLPTRSEKFRTLWAAHGVGLHQSGVKYFHHPAVGELAVPFEAMPIPTEPGLTLTALSTKPGTPAHDSLRLLPSGPPPATTSTAHSRVV
jgi:hypothetical protein